MAGETQNVNTEGTENQQQTEDKVELPQSQSELDSIIGKAIDKALKNNDKKWAAKTEQAVADAKKEAESYAKMTQAQRKNAEIEKREKALDEREAKLNHKALIADIQADLTDKGLPTVFADALSMLKDNEAIASATQEIKDAWDKSVNERLKANARQKTPGTSAESIHVGKSLAEFAAQNRIIK